MRALIVAPLPAMTRPVYPYSHVAQYSGVGDYTDAATWEKRDPAEVVTSRDRPGVDLFGVYTPTEQ